MTRDGTVFWRPVSPQGIRNLKDYSNTGADHGLLYTYVTKPFLMRVIEYVPQWVAPNAITFSGFLFSLLAYAVMAYYAPYCSTTATDTPRWVYALCAICLRMYSLLDNLDGRQAVRTRSSSPLGELFDHGVDALTVTLGGLTISSALDFGPSEWMLYLLVIGYIPFMTATWEEYHTGRLVLGYINGPGEGIVMVEMAFWWTWYAGPAFWWKPAGIVLPWLPEGLHGFSMNKVLVIVSFIGLLFSALPNVINVQRHVLQHRKTTLAQAMSHLLPGTVVLTTSWYWIFHSPEHLWESDSRLVALFMGVCFAYCMSNLTLAHVTKSPVTLFHAILLLPVAGASNCWFYYNLPFLYVDEFFLLCFLVVAAWTVYLLFVFGTIEQLTVGLNIWVFSLGPRDRPHCHTDDCGSPNNSSVLANANGQHVSSKPSSSSE